MHDPIEVLVADPHAVMLESLCKALEADGRVCVAARAADMLGALRLAGDDRPAVAVVDQRLVSLASPETIDALRPLTRRLPVVVMGMGDPTVYGEPYRAAGASGYWAKSDEVSALVELVTAAGDRRRSAA